MSEQPGAGAEQPQDQQQFGIQKVYMKDMSFETPNSPAVFTQEWKPEINLQLNSSGNALADGVHEVVLSVTVTAKMGDTTAYLAEVQQAGIFNMSGFDENQTGHMLGAFCPNVLYPFAREAIADLVGKGGFPPVYLAPVNFDALYAQKLREVQAQVADPSQQAAH
jgi:preprotein translocase subunit SecB